MVEHRNEAARALRGSQAAWHLHGLHQQLGQLLSQLQQHQQGPGLLWWALQWAQQLPILPRKEGRLHLQEEVVRRAQGCPWSLNRKQRLGWTDVVGEGAEECDGGHALSM